MARVRNLVEHVVKELGRGKGGGGEGNDAKVDAHLERRGVINRRLLISATELSACVRGRRTIRQSAR